MADHLAVMPRKTLLFINIQVFWDTELFGLVELYLGESLEMAGFSMMPLGIEGILTIWVCQNT